MLVWPLNGLQEIGLDTFWVGPFDVVAVVGWHVKSMELQLGWKCGLLGELLVGASTA